MTEQAPTKPAASASGYSLVVKNALFLIVAQVLTTPLAALVTFAMARYIGPADFGRLYLVTTFCSFAFLAVDWGQGNTIAAMVARDRSKSGEILGSGLVWRALTAVIVTGGLAVVGLALGHGNDYLELLALVVLGLILANVGGACQETIRGFERTDISAYTQVGGQFLTACVVIVTLFLGGRLHAVLGVQALCGAIVLAFVWRTLRPVGVGALSVSQPRLKALFSEGLPFVFFGLVMALQPSIDAYFMARLVPREVVGWHSATYKLIGFLVMPASAIIRALYPTLCRLFAEDMEGYKRTTSSALRMTTVLAVPFALCCALYPHVGISILGTEQFGPATTNIRYLSIFLFLLYFSMPLGISLLAGGRQRVWSIVQALCIVVSAGLDPLLIPYFQRTAGNGSLGVCIASILSELFMVSFGIVLAPKGIFGRALLRQIGLCMVAGFAMFLVSRGLGGMHWLVSAPAAGLAYFGALWLIGGIDKEQVATVRGLVSRKLSRQK